MNLHEVYYYSEVLDCDQYQKYEEHFDCIMHVSSANHAVWTGR